jgi:single-stranded-DNA-specific exonuclease
MKSIWDVTTNKNETLLQQILQARKLTEAELNKTIKDFPDEALLSNIADVADRIKEALYKNESIVIFGHDDPDGITSTYILYKYLESIGYQKHHYYIPNRNIENHGIQASFIEFVKANKFSLVITVDNGISANDGVEALNLMGCDVLVTDHHLIQPEKLPNAYAILNPQLPEDKYPFKMLSGVGVVLMLIRYLSNELEHPIDLYLYFWTAVGSIADKVPMTGINRIIVNHVIANWSDIDDYTIDFLFRNYRRITTVSDKIGFLQYCARFIANGREINGEHKAMKFLLQLSDEKASMFETLEEEKNGWEAELNKVFKLVDTLLADFEGESFIYFDDGDLIPYSLLGTAATYVVNNLSIPTLFLKARNDIIVCEGRCTNSFNMVEAFTYCKDWLIQYGGHAKAAGFTIEPDNYNVFIEKFHEHLKSYLESSKLVHKISIDAVIDIDSLSPKVWNELEILMPYGQENPEPVLLVENCTAEQLMDKFVIDNNHNNLPKNVNYDVVIQLKNCNVIKVIDYQPTSL